MTENDSATEENAQSDSSECLNRTDSEKYPEEYQLISGKKP